MTHYNNPPYKKQKPYATKRIIFSFKAHGLNNKIQCLKKKAPNSCNKASLYNSRNNYLSTRKDTTRA